MTRKAVRQFLILIVILGVAELPAQARRFGGGRSFGGGGFSRRAPSGGGGLFRSRPSGSGFSRPRPAPTPTPSTTAPSGGISTPAPAARPGGFGGTRSAPSDGAAGSITTPAPAARPGTGSRAATEAAGPSSITTTAPSARPEAGARTGPRAEGPTSITTTAPASRPRVPGRAGQPGQGSRLPAPAPPPGSAGGYQRYPGGVYAPTGISPWGFYPFHYFWWLGVPRPIGYPYGHASVLGTLFVTVLFILLLAGIGLLIALAVRRRRRHIPLLRMDELEKRRSSG